MKSISTIIYSLLLILTYQSIQAQTGTISGKAIDKITNETLIGVSVVIQGTVQGALTDIDGRYRISNLKPGNYVLVFSYVSYSTKIITDIKVSAGNNTEVNIVMEQSSTELKTAEVTAEVNRQSNVSLVNMIRTNTAMVDGISAETIKRSPDKTTGEALKRVSGTSVQDNKFVIVRGMSDRYNSTLINGMPFPSTEPDRKAVSFDIFPSALIDNLIISKTATPDLPGDFAGGLIQINTREIPDENAYQIGVGTGMNSQSTFNTYYRWNTGNKDWLGVDDGTRALPGFIPPTEEFQSASLNKKIKISQRLENDWAQYQEASAPLEQRFNFTVANRYKFGKSKEFGIMAGGNYIGQQRLKISLRNDYNENDTTTIYSYTDNEYSRKVLWGGILNLSLKLNDRNKITWKNMMSVNGECKTTLRTGTYFENQQLVRDNFNEYSSTRVGTSQLEGIHYLEKFKLSTSWGLSYSRTYRDIPNRRRISYTADLNGDTSDYIAYVPFGSASPSYAGKFYSELLDNMTAERIDLSLPMFENKYKLKQKIKFGGMFQQKNRDFVARTLGFVIPNAGTFNYSYLYSSQDTLFDPTHMSANGFILDEISNTTDAYNAGIKLYAGYLLFDNYFTKSLHVIWGVRYEKYNQQLQSGLDSKLVGEQVDQKLNEDDLLPSVNMIYALNQKSNIRFSVSQTVARAEFRELAPFAFYDFTELATVYGNPDLKNTKINNFDIRYELFPSANQQISVTGFYKKFKNPIEQSFNSSGAGTRNFTFINAPAAFNAGLELEVRVKPFSKVWPEAKFADYFSVFGNLALIHSEVDLSQDVNVTSKSRPLQGQSPYVFNAGVQFLNTVNGLGATLQFNRIGKRIDKVGAVGRPDLWEAPRSVLDLQLTYKAFNKLELRLNFNDLLNQSAVFYQELNGTKKYEEEADNLIIKTTYGTSYSFGMAYTF